VKWSVPKYVSEFEENMFASDGGVLFFNKMREIKVNSEKRFTVARHKTEKRKIL